MELYHVGGEVGLVDAGGLRGKLARHRVLEGGSGLLAGYGPTETD